jgi:dTDP-4-dehydrorhamnose reductase
MDQERLLIIGASGFVGMHAAQAAVVRNRFKVIRGNRSRTDQSDTVEIDITDPSSVAKAFRESRPDSVLLLAALSDIDACERSPERAFAINTCGAEHVANACLRGNARLLFTSSAAVFDGVKHGYSEEDTTCPVSIYGTTKMRAESVIRALLPSAVLIRLALVLGFAPNRTTNALLDKVITKWKSGQPVYFPKGEHRNPIDVASLGSAIIDLIANEQISGIYHLGASNSISRYELGVRFASRLGYPLDLVRPLETPEAGRAPRGKDHFLLTDKIQRECGLQFGSSDQVIERCFS